MTDDSKEPANGVWQTDTLDKFLNALLRISSELNAHKIAAIVIDETCKLLQADRATLFFVDWTTNELILLIAKGVKDIRLPIGNGIAGTVANSDDLSNVPDAYKDPRFNSSFDKKTGYRTRSVICIPVKDQNNETVAVLQVINKLEEFGIVFTKADEVILTRLAKYVGVTLRNVKYYEQAASSKKQDLLSAAVKGEIAEVQRLVDAGADVNYEDTFGHTALLEASREGHAEIVQILITAQANVNHIPTEEGGATALISAAEMKHSKVLSILINANADVNAVDKMGNTAMNKASKLEMIHELLGASADVNVPNETGWIPLLTAAKELNNDIVEVLLASKSDVNHFDKVNESSPVILAASRNDMEVLRALLVAKADFSHCSHQGSALMQAALSGNLEAVDMLLSFDADVNQTHKGRTPLMNCAIGGHTEIVQRLLSFDVDVVKPDEVGHTALHHALMGGYHGCVDSIMPYFIDQMTEETQRGVSLFDCAVLSENKGGDEAGEGPNLVKTIAKKFVFPEARFVPYSSLSSISELASGTYGVVYRADLNIGDTRDGSAYIPVVCKVSKQLEAGSNEWHELQILQNIPHHQNVLGLLAMCTGFVVEKTKRTAIILVYKEGGSLLTFLKNKKETLPVEDLLHFALDISKAVAMIHKNGYKHNDIAARNVLMTEKPENCNVLNLQSLALTDFGLARPLEFQYSHQNSVPPIPVRWCAPEVLHSVGMRTSMESDIWMLGVTFWEMGTPTYTTPFTTPFLSIRDLVKFMEKGKLMCFPRSSSARWKKLVSDCCQLEPSQRPSADNISEIVTKMVKTSTRKSFAEQTVSDRFQRHQTVTEAKYTEDIYGVIGDDNYIEVANYDTYTPVYEHYGKDGLKPEHKEDSIGVPYEPVQNNSQDILKLNQEILKLQRQYSQELESQIVLLKKEKSLTNKSRML